MNPFEKNTKVHKKNKNQKEFVIKTGFTKKLFSSLQLLWKRRKNFFQAINFCRDDEKSFFKSSTFVETTKKLFSSHQLL